MSDAASETGMTTEVKTLCPDCGSKAKRLNAVTLRALLKDDIARQIAAADGHPCGDATDSEATGYQPVSGDTGWRFCDSPDCDVVYFSAQDDTTFTKSDLKVEVGVKETSGERPLCYCFRHSVGSMKCELQASGTCTALEDIRAKMTGPGCRCETENPSGSCCLGNVAKGLKVAQQELNMSDDDEPTPTDEDSKTLSTGRGEKIATAGTLISAIMASSCCWLPLVLLAVGVSGAGIASTLETYRPYFMVVTFGFLGAAFYFTYRPKNVPAGNGHDCCAPQTTAARDCCATEPATSGDCCAPNSGRRLSMMTLNKVMLWGVMVLAVAFLFFPSYVGVFLANGDGSKVTEDMNRAVIKLDGMTCEACAVNVVNVVRKVPGVLAVEVDYAKREAIVGSEFCCPLPKQKILAAISKAGYEGELTKEIPARVNATPTLQNSQRPASVPDTTTTGENNAQLRDISSDAREFRQAFNDAKDTVRVVLLVSPG